MLFHLPPLSPFKIKPNLPALFSLKIQNPLTSTYPHSRINPHTFPASFFRLLFSFFSSSSSCFFFPYVHSSVFLLFSFFFFFLSLFFTTHLDLFFSLPLHFDFISPVLFVVVLMLVGFGFENGVTAS